MKKRIFFSCLIFIALLIGCEKEITFDDFFRRTMNEMHKGEKNYAYTLVHKQLNVVHDNDAIAIFKENKSKEETIFIAYFEKENGNWNWIQTMGARWGEPIKWWSMNKAPYIYLGAISDKSISKVYAGKVPATIIEVEGDKRFWYAISDVKDVQVNVVKSDGTQEKVEQTEGDGWIKNEY